MRGKLVVISMVLSTVLLFAYSLWFVNNHTPLDERFNMRRQPLADDAPGGLLLRERAGDFKRQSLNTDTLDIPSAARHGTAIYLDFEGKPIQLEVQLLGSAKPTIADIFADFATRAGGKDSTAIKLHPESRIAYGYGVYSAPNYTYHEFSWINGNWIIRVATREAGGESLLRFANGYPY